METCYVSGLLIVIIEALSFLWYLQTLFTCFFCVLCVVILFLSSYFMLHWCCFVDLCFFLLLSEKHAEFIGQTLLLYLYLVCTVKLLNIECRSRTIYTTITIWPTSIQTENQQDLSKEQTFELFDIYIHINLVLHEFFSIRLY